MLWRSRGGSRVSRDLKKVSPPRKRAELSHKQEHNLHSAAAFAPQEKKSLTSLAQRARRNQVQSLGWGGRA